MSESFRRRRKPTSQPGIHRTTGLGPLAALGSNQPTPHANTHRLARQPRDPGTTHPGQGDRHQPGVERSVNPRSTPPKTPAPRRRWQTARFNRTSADDPHQPAHGLRCSAVFVRPPRTTPYGEWLCAKRGELPTLSSVDNTHTSLGIPDPCRHLYLSPFSFWAGKRNVVPHSPGGYT